MRTTPEGVRRIGLDGRPLLRWGTPVAFGGLILIVGTACLLEGWRARKVQGREGRDCGCAAEIAELGARLDASDEAWDAWYSVHGRDRSAITVIRGGRA